MYHLAKSIYFWATSKEEYSILLLGLDNAGKTTLLSTIKTLYTHTPPPSKPTVPTVGQNVAIVSLPDMYLKIWDVGGQHALRSMWTSYYSVCHAIVFVVDGCDVGDGDVQTTGGGGGGGEQVGRLEECRKTLESVLSHPSTKSVPLLVLANKQDREDCVETVRIKEGLVRKVFESEGMNPSPRDSRVLPVSALKGEGVREAVEWVRSRVKWNREERAPVMR
ncbi:ADP-ribosylation factor protein 3 [Lecanora helva]